MAERLYGQHEAPADTEEVTSNSGAGSYAVIGVGATGGVLVQSLAGVGFDNAILFGLSDIDPIDIPTDRKIHLVGNDPTNMQEGENIAASNLPLIFETMQKKLGRPDRVFLCIGADGKLSAGSTLVMLECVTALLKKCGHESTQRIGVFVAAPTAAEMQFGQVVRDTKFLTEKLLDLNQRRFFDPLIISDRSNICTLLDGLAAPLEDLAFDDVDATEEAEEEPAEQLPKKFGSSLYEE